MTFRRLRGGADRIVRARVARGAVGTQLETIGYVERRRRPAPARRSRASTAGWSREEPRASSAVAAAAGPRWRGFCALPSDYTL